MIKKWTLINKRFLLKPAVMLMLLLVGFAMHCNHVYAVSEDWTTTKEPTCTTKGERYRVIGNTTEIEEIPSLGHQFDGHTTAADCQNPGTLSKVCRVCGYTTTETTEAVKPHNYVETLYQAPGCEVAGKRESICDVCEEVKTETIAATGHAYGEWTIVNKATRETPGFRVKDCAVCGNQIGETASIDGTVISTETVSNKDRVEAASPSPTSADIVILVIDAAVLLLFILLIQVDISKILWDRRNRKIFKKENEKVSDEIKKLGFH